MHIRPLHTNDLPMLARHRARHSRENGRDGDFIFAPSEEDYPSREEDLKRESDALAKSILVPGWMRVWIVTDELEIFGELTLVNRPPMKSTLHRCLLMIGLERSIRRQGWGSKLLVHAIGWAKEQPSLAWVSLYVFEGNPPAKALYKKFGFQEVGTNKDMFRVFGQSIDDTEMVLPLKTS